MFNYMYMLLDCSVNKDDAVALKNGNCPMSY